MAIDEKMKKDNFMKMIDDLSKSIKESEKFLADMETELSSLEEIKLDPQTEASLKNTISKLPACDEQEIRHIVKEYEEILTEDLNASIHEDKKRESPLKTGIKKPRIRRKI